MRLIKLALISAVLLFMVVLGISLLIPSEVRISRAINISADKDSIMTVLADLRQWRHWNVLVNDSSVTNPQYDYKVFHSDQLQIEMWSAKADTLQSLWRQQNGKEIVSGFTFHTQNNVTVVQWYFDFHLRWYPWEKFSSIIFDKQLGPPMERSLNNLKEMVEGVGSR